MTREQIKNITNRHYRKLVKYSKHIPEHFDGETIHRFRVEYKKLRAFLRILSQSDQIESEIKVAKNLKRVYQFAGSLRDLQLQQQRIHAASEGNPGKSRAYLHLLKKETDQKKTELKAMLDEKPVSESRKKTNAMIPETLSMVDVRGTVQKKWKSIHALIRAGHFTDEMIHSIRKHLKDLFYNMDTLSKIERAVSLPPEWNGKNRTYYNRLIEELGKYQDCCTSVALLKTNWLMQLSARNQELPALLKKEWTKEKTSRKKKLVQQLSTALAGKR